MQVDIVDVYVKMDNLARDIKSAIGNAMSLNMQWSLVIIVLCCIIIWNQRKIKKMLRDLQEQMEQKEQDETD